VRLSPSSRKELSQVIAEEAFMGFLTFDLATRTCVQFNRLARELFEFMDDLDGYSLSLEQIFATEARGDYRTFSEDLIAHEGFYQDVMVRKLSGKPFVANIGVKRLNLDGKPLVLLMVQDITLQKKLQREIVAKQIEIKGAYEELLQQNRQLKELDLAKNRFIALTTHELRTPLAAMYSSAEILHLKLYDNEEQMKEFIEMIYEQGQHILDLVNDILDYAKIQAGHMDFYIEEHALKSLVEELTTSFRGMAEPRGIEIKAEAVPEDLKCYFDDLRLKQVLSNILNNAIKYNKDDGQVRIWSESDDEWVKVFVTDSGRGIPQDQLEKVFNEFETLGQVSLHHKGTGLGMPISRRLMEGMGGRLQVESTVGKGSTFWVEIPRQRILSESLYRPRPSLETDLAS